MSEIWLPENLERQRQMEKMKEAEKAVRELLEYSEEDWNRTEELEKLLEEAGITQKQWMALLVRGKHRAWTSEWLKALISTAYLPHVLMTDRNLIFKGLMEHFMGVKSQLDATGQDSEGLDTMLVTFRTIIEAVPFFSVNMELKGTYDKPETVQEPEKSSPLLT